MTDNNPRNETNDLLRMADSILNKLFGITEDEYTRNQEEALNDFRNQARYSFVHNETTHCYSQLTEAQKYQTANNITTPIWDAVNQEYVN